MRSSSDGRSDRDVDGAPREQAPRDRVGQLLAIEQPAVAVACLRPRVGKVDVHGCHRRRRHQAFEDAACVPADDAHVRQAACRDRVGEHLRESGRALDREEVGLRPPGREREQHVTTPGTDLDLDRVRIAEERRPERGGGVHCRATGRRPARGARPPPFRPARKRRHGPRVEHVRGRDPAAAGLVDAEALSVDQVCDAVGIASRSRAGRRRTRRAAGARRAGRAAPDRRRARARCRSRAPSR